MSQTYTPSEALTYIKPTYICVYLALQLASIIFLTSLDNSPLVLSYAVALMAMRYAMTKLTTKYGQDPSIGLTSDFLIFVALANLVVTGMLMVSMSFTLSFVDLIIIFVFLNIFSLLGVFLQKWYAFIRSLRKNT
jgi:hypothetical protein